jgi:hypothetical protein
MDKVLGIKKVLHYSTMCYVEKRLMEKGCSRAAKSHNEELCDINAGFFTNIKYAG